MKLLKAEFVGIMRDKKLLIPIIAVLFIPILYAGMFLWAFWDPYERLDELPVAIVNEDEGAIFEGSELQLGDELVSKLEESSDFQFHFVSKDEGLKGLEEQNYYMLVEIPNKFSEHATTLMDDNPKKLDLIYIPNESYNFLSSQIGETAVLKIQTSLQEKITETYAETMFDKITELADGMEQASDGAKKLTDGINDVDEGTNELHDNLVLLAEKSIEFSDGTGKLDSGASELATGTKALSQGLGELVKGHKQIELSSKQIANGNKQLVAGIKEAKGGISEIHTSLPTIVSGTEQLSVGSKSLAEGLNLWQTKANEAAIGADKVSKGITELGKQLEQILPYLDEQQQHILMGTVAQLEAGSNQVSVGVNSLSNSATTISNNATYLSQQLIKVNEGQKVLQRGIGKLSEGSSELEKGAEEIVAGQQQLQAGITLFGSKLGDAATGSLALTDGSNQLTDGVKQLYDGSTSLVDGTSKLAEGSEKLSSGTVELLDGSDELSTKLSEGADEISSVQGDDEKYNMFAKPVEVTQQKLNEVPNYGTGFSPYFLSLGLFVGALLLSIVFPLTEPMGLPRSGFNWFTSKFIILVGIGIIQALLAVSLLLFGLKLDVQNVPLFVLFTIITSITFIALIQFLVTLFDNPGRFVAIIILIMQLTTSAGTFPLELIPNVLQPFNAFLPMTYSVQGLKAVISSGDMTFMWKNALVLFGFTLICIVGTVGYFNFNFKRKFVTIQETA